TATTRSLDGSSPLIYLQRPFVYFEKTYNTIYVNHNGHLTFTSQYWSYIPQRFPLYGPRDIIAPFWTDMDIRLTGLVLYNQYTNGSVLQQATQDINSYFPNLNFSAEWVFVATWYEVAYYPTTGTVTTFQAVLISGGEKSFVLMNYGSLAATVWNAGYDTIGSVHHLTLPGSFSSSASGVNSTFSLSSNINVTGRWALRVDSGPEGSFYPISGTASSRSDDGSSPLIYLQRSFVYFGKTYNTIYVNHNGHLTFNSPYYSYIPQRFPLYGSMDIIAPFWTDLDNRQNGFVLYNQYTNGSVLQQATQDINSYFPNLNFSAEWVFVATWYEVAYFGTTGTKTTFQAVLISGGQKSFILMNYGSIASTSRSVQ
uniref:NIDO domain-containing protein n=1 Tax=Oryzias melastigma TaxID=30732 RepID=A0A3B3DWK2_ORYME